MTFCFISIAILVLIRFRCWFRLFFFFLILGRFKFFRYKWNEWKWVEAVAESDVLKTTSPIQTISATTNAVHIHSFFFIYFLARYICVVQCMREEFYRLRQYQYQVNGI